MEGRGLTIFMHALEVVIMRSERRGREISPFLCEEGDRHLRKLRRLRKKVAEEGLKTAFCGSNDLILKKKRFFSGRTRPEFIFIGEKLILNPLI